MHRACEEKKKWNISLETMMMTIIINLDDDESRGSDESSGIGENCFYVFI